MNIKESSVIQELDKTFALAAIALSLVMVIFYSLILGRIIYLFVGILIIVSSTIWLIIRKNQNLIHHFSESRIQTMICGIAFFLLFTISIFSIYFRPNLYERPTPYFIIVALMATTLAIEAITSKKRYSGLILIQIVLLSLNIIWSQLLLFPGLIGIDPWYHYAFTNHIVNEGFIPENMAYTELPVFHIVISEVSIITNLPYKFAVMLSVSLVQVICISFFTYIIANSILKNHQVGLLASLFVMFADLQIRMSFWSIPNAFAAVFIIIIIYLILIRDKSEAHGPNAIFLTLLTLLFMGVLILTHTIAALSMALLLFVTWASTMFYQNMNSMHSKKHYLISTVTPIGFIVAMFTWWSYASGQIELLKGIIDWGFNIDRLVNIPNEIAHYATSAPANELLFNSCGTFLFFTFSLIGIYYMISRKGNHMTFTMAMMGLAPLSIGFLFIITGTDVIQQRWWYLAQILLCLPLGVAIYSVIGWKPLKRHYSYIIVFCFVLTLSFFMITSPNANIDNHTFSPNTSSTWAYYESELTSSGFFYEKTIGNISSDSDFCTNPSSSIFIHVYGVNPERLLSIDNSLISGNFINDDSILIIRSKCIEEPFIRGVYIFDISPNTTHDLINSGFNRIYYNPYIGGFT